jgi:predicted GNAT family N-acyltransferase
MAELLIEKVADAHEMLEAFAIRREVFCIEQGVSEADEMDGRDGDCRHYLVRTLGVAIATARVMPGPPGVEKVQRVAVKAAHRRRGVGRALMQRIVDDARGRGVRRLELDAQCYVETFYRDLGFVTEGEAFMEAGIPHVRMACTLSAS